MEEDRISDRQYEQFKEWWRDNAPPRVGSVAGLTIWAAGLASMRRDILANAIDRLHTAYLKKYQRAIGGVRENAPLKAEMAEMIAAYRAAQRTATVALIVPATLGKEG